MKISVIIPSYNRFGMLKKCLDSILNQSTCANYEIIIVDDCSIDNTQELSELYIQNCSTKNIRYIRNDVNLGLARTRNVGIRNALGDILVFLDNDLVVCNNFLQLHLDLYSMYDTYKIGVVSSVTYKPEYLEKSNFGSYIQSRAIGYREKSEMKGIDLEDLPDNYFAGGASSCTKRFADEIGGFEEGLTKYGAEDELFGFRFKKFGGRIVFCREAKVIHDDPNVFPKYWKIKYEEMGKYSLKTLELIEPELIKNSLYKYLFPININADSIKTMAKKGIITFFSSTIFRKIVEFYVFKTDSYPRFSSKLLYRYLTVAWMKFGYNTKDEIENVKY